MDLNQLEKALLPYEKKLRNQEKRRRLLGVREVERPTYEKYIIGPIERFDRRKNVFSTLAPENPFGAEILQRFKKRTGHDSIAPISYAELANDERVGQALTGAVWRLCKEYHPDPVPVTPPEGRFEIRDIDWMTRLIKKVGLFVGAEMVRITRVDQRWVYAGLDIPHKYAIVLVVKHVKSMQDTAPSHLSSAVVADTYSRLKFITTEMTDFIRGLGYDASTRETLDPNLEMILVPTAIDAGVGEFSRNGRVLSPEFGTNMRMKVVTTDMPLKADRPVSFGVHDFCMACESCAIFCPSGAVPFGPPTDELEGIYNNPGFRKWYVNAEKCITFWAINKRRWTSCGGRCLAVCPWSKPLVPSHNIIRWLAIHSPALVRKLLIRADRTLYKRTRKINRE